MAFLKRHATTQLVTQSGIDMLLLLAAYALAAQCASVAGGSFQSRFMGHLGYLVALIVVWCAAAGDLRPFTPQRPETFGAHVWRAVKSAVVTIALTGLLMVFLNQERFDKIFLIWVGASTLLVMPGSRLFAWLYVWNLRRQGQNLRQILIVGSNERAAHLVNVMMAHGEYGYQLMGMLDEDPSRARFLDEFNVPYLGTLSDLERILLEHVIDEVYVCLPVRTYYETITSMAYLCEGIGTPLRMIADLFPLRIATSRVRQLEDIPLLSLSVTPDSQTLLLLKRVIDLAISSAFLVTVAWWLFPIVAILIKLDSKGPVFFQQERVGLNQRRFKMIKFRSMVAEAEAMKAALLAQNEADGPVFKMRRDPRMTRVGRWIRKFSIDELPQFINAFLGHMSIVGPRPPVPSEVEKYTWDQRRRLSVRPGITGLQQVSGRSDVDFEQWVELDLAYIDNWTLMEDIRIMLRTFQVVITGKGAA